MVDSCGFHLVELPDGLVTQAQKHFPGNADSAINFAISHMERARRIKLDTIMGNGPEAA